MSSSAGLASFENQNRLFTDIFLMGEKSKQNKTKPRGCLQTETGKKKNS